MIGCGGDELEAIEISSEVEVPEFCRELVRLRLRLEREKEAVKLDSMPIVLDLGIRTTLLRVGDIGPRSRRALGGTFFKHV